MPKRIQLTRAKDWRLPENAVNVARPTKWGNPFSVAEYGRTMAVRLFREYMETAVKSGSISLDELRGKDLACWCPLINFNGDHVPCHADVLLEMANGAGEIKKEANNEHLA